MYMNLGEDYDERVLPSITTEVLKAVVVRLSDLFSPIEKSSHLDIQTLLLSVLFQIVVCRLSLTLENS